MLIYTLILLPLTVIPVFFGSLGILYGLAAIALGARLLWMLVGLMRSSGAHSVMVSSSSPTGARSQCRVAPTPSAPTPRR